MKITTRSNNQKPAEYKHRKVVQAQEELYEEVPSAILDRGKYLGRSLAWVKSNDKSYYSWMIDKGLVIEWNLCRLKDTAMEIEEPAVRPIWVQGDKWIELREVNEETTASVWL